MSDPWIHAAQEFYKNESVQKSDPTQFKKFSKSYKELLKRFPVFQNKKIIDLGCSTGYLTNAFSENTLQVIGVDVSYDSLLVAHGKSPEAFFIQGDMTDLPLKSAQFDVGVLMTSLEFCCDKKKALTELSRVLKTTGFCYFEVRNADFPFYKLIQSFGFLRTLLLKNYSEKHFKDLSLKEWEDLIKSSGFKIVSLHISLRPWQYGPWLTCLKNLMIEVIKQLFPIRFHYLTGLYCEKI